MDKPLKITLLQKDTIKNYFPLSNEVVSLSLISVELAVYSYQFYLKIEKT